MKIDAKEITGALRAFFVKGDVFEIRCLEATLAGKGYSYPHVESGYFDYDHIDEVPKCLETLESAKGVYVTINPVSEVLLSRANNRIFNPKREPRTTDKDIVKRRWLFIDCDAIRPSGICSSDEEHEASISKANEIKEGMMSIGWPEPIIVDSGNGAHLLYAIDIPTNDDGLIERIVKRISVVSDTHVDIDKSVFNAARIVRLPGTYNCKGDNTEKRPYRIARIISRPKSGCELVSENMLLDVAGEKEPAVQSACKVTETNYGNEFNLDEWIRQYCPEARQPVESNGGRKWIFSECPFNDSHKAPDSFMFQYPNGAFYFKCSHNSCSGHDFHALRDLKEPGWKDKPRICEDSGVDINGIISAKTDAANDNSILDDVPEEELKESSEYIQLPKEVYNVHGFIKSVMDLTLKYAPSPNKPLALAGALTLMSFLCGRKVKTESGLRPNIYLLALAKSGAGKEKPRDVNQLILEEIGLDNHLVENVASGEGLEDKMAIHKSLFWQCDEFYSLIKSITNDRNDVKQSLMKYLLVFYTSAHKNFTTREKAGTSGVTIPKPYLTLFATTAPDGFFNSISEQFLNDGMFARLNIIVAEEPQRAKMMPDVELTDDIVKFAKTWRDFVPESSGNIDVSAMTVPFTSNAREMACEIFEKEQYDIKKDIKEEWKASAWNRYFELIMRYALIYACSESSSPDKTVITPEAISWARTFIKWEIENKIHITERKFYKNDFEKQSEGVIEFMKRWHDSHGEDPMPAWKFNRLAKALKDKKAIVESLTGQKRLIHDITSTGGRPRDVFYLPEFAKKEKKEKK